MKNLLKVAAFMSVLLIFACQKTDTASPLTTDSAAQVAADELTVVVGTGGGGNAVDTARDDKRGGTKDDKHGGFGKDEKGKCGHPSGMKGDSIGFNQLPAAAQAYVNANKGTATVSSVVKITGDNGVVRYAVRLSDKTHFHFDAAGALIPADSRGHKFTVIAYDALPAAAKAFLATKTDVTKITHVIQIVLKDGTVVYGVRTADNKHFLFDAAGNLLPTNPRKK